VGDSSTGQRNDFRALNLASSGFATGHNCYSGCQQRTSKLLACIMAAADLIYSAGLLWLGIYLVFKLIEVQMR
jgi:hypothetical protein